MMKVGYKRRRTKAEKEEETTRKEIEAMELEEQKQKVAQYDELLQRFNYQANELNTATEFATKMIDDGIVESIDKDSKTVNYTEDALKLASKKKGPFNPAGQKYR